MKKLMLGLMMAFAANGAFAESEPMPIPSVTVNKVETANPWESEKGKITVDYSLSGFSVRDRSEYKVAFDVTAKNVTRGITNDWAKLSNGQDVKTIDTAVLFGKENVDRDAEISIKLIKKRFPAGQLWENGPIWAEGNLGESEAQDHPEYGALYTCDKADAAVKSLLGFEWRVPSKDDFDKLVDTSYCTRTWDDTRKGWTFAGLGDYSSNSIFLSAAGYDIGSGRDTAGNQGNYWSSTVESPYIAWHLNLQDYQGGTQLAGSGNGYSVRAVRDNRDGVELVFAACKVEFCLGPGCESCPWMVGNGVTAYIKGMTLHINGSGAVASTPWADTADGIIKLQVGDGMTRLGGTMATLPNLTSVNGLSMSALGDLAVIPDDMVLVTKESIAAAKAMTVQIVNGQIELSVSVCCNADITASTANWAPVKFTPDTQIGLSGDGTKLVLPIPVSSQQGFMILQSGDAKAVPLDADLDVPERFGLWGVQVQDGKVEGRVSQETAR